MSGHVTFVILQTVVENVLTSAVNKGAINNEFKFWPIKISDIEIIVPKLHKQSNLI